MVLEIKIVNQHENVIDIQAEYEIFFILDTEPLKSDVGDTYGEPQMDSYYLRRNSRLPVLQ